MKKSRNFSIVLYPNENEKDKKTLEYIIKYFEYAYIEHDKDIWEEDTEEHKKGEKKKAHTHVLINLKNPRSIEAMKKELNIDYIETCNFYAYTRYLIHLGYNNKYQYSEKEIKTNMEIRINNALKREYNSEEQDARILLDYIFKESNGSYLTFRKLTEYALKNDCLKELQKKSYFYNQFCDNTGFKRF